MFLHLFYLALSAKSMSYFFGSRFLETRRLSESQKPLIGMLAYLEPKLWLKDQKLDKNSSPTKGNLGHFG